jgi:hypothetical protein
MGKRSRKRGDAVAAPVPPSARSARGRRAAARDSRPRAPWHPFPLVELCVFIGIVLMVWGLIRSGERSGQVLLISGMALASLGGLDTAAREHFSGHSPHGVLLAGVPAVALAGILFFARAPWIVVVLAGGVLFAVAYMLLRRAFRRRS